MENLNTENFRAKVKKRLGMAAAYNGLLLVVFAFNFLFGKELQVPDFSKGFVGGVCIGIQLVMLYFVGKYIRALKNGENLKAMYIEENDERAELIARKVGQMGFTVVLGAVSLGMVVFVFINQIVFFTLLAVTGLISLMSVILKLYYERKI